ncbi:ROK family protein [Paludisphaera mucosa]|uniref:ROK family protein n=1 Tax=Paludisphaera mucosa TaxID=3030827 RepID=A0ABT6FDS8_9BACT|nr:ROK family protein [Paludisphaera mucosa]MDG3005739.1 ROK family protein [Paludisphaera mucosa]
MSTTDVGWLLGIEIGGTKLQLGLGRRPGSIDHLKRATIDPARGAEGIREQIRKGFLTLRDEVGLSAGDVRAAGVGFGGPLDAETGRTETSFQVEGWTDFPLADWARENLEIPVVSVHNDADVAGLAESRLGAGVGCSPLLYLTIGSGIGGALILDGRIYRGAGRGAAEIGHLRVPGVAPDDPLDMPELEAVASGWGIGRLAGNVGKATQKRGDRWSVLEAAGAPERITAVDVADAAWKGDERSLAILDRAREALTFALCQAVALIAPRRIILGGGVSLIGEKLWFRPIRERVDAQVFRPFRGSFDIVPAALGEEVVVHGALELARDALAAS